MDTSRISFLPENYLSGKQNRRTNVLCGLLAAVILSATGSAFYLSDASLRAAARQHEEVSHRYAAAAKRLNQFQQMQKQQEVLSRQADISATLIDRLKRSDVLADITQRMPGEAWLTNLELFPKKRASDAPKVAVDKKAPKTPKKPAVAPVEQMDAVVRLMGVAKDDAQVAQLLASLKESSLYSEVNLLLSAQDKKAEAGTDAGSRFTAEVTLQRDAPKAAAAIKAQATAQVSQ